jgi:hypothetical protein
MNELYDLTLVHYSIVPCIKFRTNYGAEASLPFHSLRIDFNYFHKKCSINTDFFSIFVFFLFFILFTKYFFSTMCNLNLYFHNLY